MTIASRGFVPPIQRSHSFSEPLSIQRPFYSRTERTSGVVSAATTGTRLSAASLTSSHESNSYKIYIIAAAQYLPDIHKTALTVSKKGISPALYWGNIYNTVVAASLNIANPRPLNSPSCISTQLMEAIKFSIAKS